MPAYSVRLEQERGTIAVFCRLLVIPTRTRRRRLFRNASCRLPGSKNPSLITPIAKCFEKRIRPALYLLSMELLNTVP